MKSSVCKTTGAPFRAKDYSGFLLGVPPVRFGRGLPSAFADTAFERCADEQH